MISDRVLSFFKSTVFTGVTVGVGSNVLIFDNGSSIILSCPFEVFSGGKVNFGHGEDFGTSVFLFCLLNKSVVDVSMDGRSFVFGFEDNFWLKITPDFDGLESLVLTTKIGIFPVLGV